MLSVDAFVLLKVAVRMALPPASLIAAVIVAAGFWALGRRRSGVILVALAFLQMAILSFPPVADGLMGILEDQARADAAKTKPCCYAAIVVLGGGVAPGVPPDRPDPDLTEGADRVWEAARMFQRGVAPQIVASGGGQMLHPGREDATEAGAMRLFLLALGVPDAAIVVESTSRNTIENIANVRRLVGDKPVALVTSAGHMPRAMRLAREFGLDAAPFPADYRSIRTIRPWWDNWIFSADTLSMSGVALRELAALFFDHRGAPARTE